MMGYSPVRIPPPVRLLPGRGCDIIRSRKGGFQVVLAFMKRMFYFCLKSWENMKS